jgi:hypothetical protein
MITKVENEFRAPSHIAESALAAHLVPTALIKTWTNIDSTTRDLVKIVISASGSGIIVDTYGACSPTPCNWGSVAGMAYAANVSSSAAVAFSAHYKFSFAHVILTGHLHGKHLIVETFTEFTDGSGRSNLYTSDTMM